VSGEAGRKARKRFSQIRAILHSDWDPIGGVPLDEYDGYVWPLFRLLAMKAPRAEVEAYLRWAADEHITCPVPEETLHRVVEKLLRLQP
jgi:hypothetical protein